MAHFQFLAHQKLKLRAHQLGLQESLLSTYSQAGTKAFWSKHEPADIEQICSELIRLGSILGENKEEREVQTNNLLSEFEQKHNQKYGEASSEDKADELFGGVNEKVTELRKMIKDGIPAQTTLGREIHRKIRKTTEYKNASMEKKRKMRQEFAETKLATSGVSFSIPEPLFGIDNVALFIILSNFVLKLDSFCYFFFDTAYLLPLRYHLLLAYNASPIWAVSP